MSADRPQLINARTARIRLPIVISVAALGELYLSGCSSDKEKVESIERELAALQKDNKQLKAELTAQAVVATAMLQTQVMSTTNNESPVPPVIPTGLPTTTPTETETATVTPILTNTPTYPEFRGEILGPQEVIAWDGASSLPQNLTDQILAEWTRKMSYGFELGYVGTRDIRTYDQMKEMGVDGDTWNYKRLTEALGNYPNGMDTGLTWIYSRPEEGYNRLPQANEIVEVLSNQAKDICTNLGVSDYRKAFNSLASQLFSFNLDKRYLYTRNTYPGVPNIAGDRKSQPERDICSIYQPDIEIGAEYISNDGILHLSNEARLALVLRISRELPDVNDPSRLATTQVFSNTKGRLFVTARLFDFSSRPDSDKFGVPAEEPVGRGWGSQILPHCGSRAVEGPQATVTLGISPTSPDTEETTPPPKPTRVSTQPPDNQPTRVATQPKK